MVDFTDIRNEDRIKEKLHSLNRQGRQLAVEFPAIEVGDFLIQVTARDKPSKWTYGPWIPQELAKLPKISELNKINVKIFEKRPKTDILSAVQVRTDKRFSNKTWTHKFGEPIGILTPDELVEIIRYLQVLNDLVAFI